MIRFWLLTAFILLISSQAPAQDIPAAQKWAQVKAESGISPPSDAAHPIAADHFISDIYFDPTVLNESKITIAAAYFPQGEGPGSENAFHWNFASSSLRKTGNGVYEAKGEIQSDKGKTKVTVPLQVSLTRDHVLMLDGIIPINQGEFNFGGLSPLYPADISAKFHITATPLFSGPGELILE